VRDVSNEVAGIQQKMDYMQNFMGGQVLKRHISSKSSHEMRSSPIGSEGETNDALESTPA